MNILNKTLFSSGQWSLKATVQMMQLFSSSTTGTADRRFLIKFSRISCLAYTKRYLEDRYEKNFNRNFEKALRILWRHLLRSNRASLCGDFRHHTDGVESNDMGPKCDNQREAKYTQKMRESHCSKNNADFESRLIQNAGRL